MKNLVPMMTSAITVLILLTVVAIPIIGTMVDNAGNPDADNTGATAGNRFTLKENYTATITMSSGTVTVSDTNAPASSNVFIVTDTVAVWVNSGRTGGEVIYKSSTNTEGSFALANGSSVTFSGTTWTAVNGQTTLTGTLTWAVVPLATGELYMPTTLPKYVDSDSTVYAIGLWAATTVSVAAGTLSDIDVLYKDATQSNIASVAATYTATAFSNEFSKLTFTMSDDSTKERNSYIIIPIEYQVAEESPMVVTIIGLAPVILIASLIMVIVGTFILRRSD